MERSYLTNATGDFTLPHGIKGNSDPTLCAEFQRLQKYPLEKMSRTCRTTYSDIGQDECTKAVLNIRSLQCRATDVNNDELLQSQYSFDTFKSYALVSVSFICFSNPLFRDTAK